MAPQAGHVRAEWGSGRAGSCQPQEEKVPATAMATRSIASYRRSCRQLRESGARELSKSAEAVTRCTPLQQLALMVRTPWLAGSYDLPQRSLLAKGRIRSAEKSCQMFNGGCEADSKASLSNRVRS